MKILSCPVNPVQEKKYINSENLQKVEKAQIALDNLVEGDFILVEFTTLKKKQQRYLAKVMEVDQGFIHCSFLRPSEKIKDAFVFPLKPDISDITIEQVIRKFERPEELRRGALKFIWVK